MDKLILNEDSDGWSRSEQQQETPIELVPDTPINIRKLIAEWTKEAREAPPIRLEGFRAFGNGQHRGCETETKNE